MKHQYVYISFLNLEMLQTLIYVHLILIPINVCPSGTGLNLPSKKYNPTCGLT